jgi:hypothetical protein
MGRNLLCRRMPVVEDRLILGWNRIGEPEMETRRVRKTRRKLVLDDLIIKLAVCLAVEIFTYGLE